MKTTTSALPDWAIVVLCTLGIVWAARDAYADGSACPTTINWDTGAFTCPNQACIGPGASCGVPAGAQGTFVAVSVQQWGWGVNGWTNIGFGVLQNQTAKACRCMIEWWDEEGEYHLVVDPMDQQCCDACLFGPGYAKIGTVGACVPGCPQPTGTCNLTGPRTAAKAECE